MSFRGCVATLVFLVVCCSSISTLLFTTSESVELLIPRQNESSYFVLSNNKHLLPGHNMITNILLAFISIYGYFLIRNQEKWNIALKLNHFLKNIVLADWQVEVLRKLPTRYTSRIFGRISNFYVPCCLRQPLFGFYACMYRCNLEEALVSDLTTYTTLTDFFTRKLKPGVRKIDTDVAMVSPADCTVLSFGSSDCDGDQNIQIDQVKGLTYPLNTFIGPDHDMLKEICKEDEEKKVFFCTLYLGPDDYHWFHSPCQMNINHRRHIPGDLFSVDPRLLRHINGIFNFNERVVLSGHWEHGPFLYAAVGAYNVGSIKLDIPMDRDLVTNCPISSTDALYHDQSYDPIHQLQPGDCIGRFEFGSTIVLTFTAPKDFKFTVQPGQKLKYGEAIGDA